MIENAKATYKFFLADSLEKIMPNEDYSEHNNIEDLYGFLNERISFQLAYSMEYEGNEINLQKIAVEVEADSLLNVKSYYVKKVPATIAAYRGQLDEDYLFKKAELCPDVLVPCTKDEVHPIPSQWNSLWISVESDSDLSSMVQQVDVVIKKSGEEIWRKKIRINYVRETLPEQKLIHTEWFHTDCLVNYYNVKAFSSRYWEIVENYIKIAVKNGINMILTPVFTPPIDTAIGEYRETIQLVQVKKTGKEYEFVFDELETWLNLCDKCGIKYYEISHLFSQWGAKYSPKIMVNEDGKLVMKFGWHVLATSDEYKDFLSQFLPKLIEFLRKRDVLERCYFHISDEPHDNEIETYCAAKDLVKELLSECKVVDALSSYEIYHRGVVENPIVSNDVIQEFIDNNVENLWTYYCCVQGHKVSNRFMSMPLSRIRIIGVQFYLYKIQGFLHWGYNFYNSQLSTHQINPYIITDADGGFPSGDPFVVYPADDGSAYESMRLVVFAEALNDLRMLQLLEGKKGREYVERIIQEDIPYTITFTEYPKGKDYLFSLRKRVCKELQ